jgi:hypothetical protein
MLKQVVPDYITTSGVILTQEFVADLYSSEGGFLPSECSDIEFATSLIGGGINFSWDTPIPNWGGDFVVEVGLMKYLGVTYNPGRSTLGFSLGASFSLPFINISLPVSDNAIGPLN